MESFPPTPVTAYGNTLLEEGIEPHITYISPDGELVFYLNGGLAPWPGVTEGVVFADGAQGLHPTFNHLDHKGARQAGVTNVGTVYDPAEMTVEVLATARTPQGLRNVIRKWMAAWDPTKRGTLSWVTPDGGEWWCQPRLFRPPPEKLARTMARSREQKFTWNMRNDDAFWRTYDSISQFGMLFNAAEDLFNRDDAGTLGSTWSQTYSGAGAGVCETDGTRAVWTPSGTAQRTVVNRWLGVNEVQTVIVAGSPTSWKLAFSGQTTGAITHPASAGTVQTALEALSNIGVGDVSVAGSSGGPYVVTFTGALAKLNVPTMTGSIFAGGTNPYVTVAKTTEGSAASTSTDNQVVKFRLGNFWQWPWPTNGRLDIWGRLDAAGTTGIKLRIDEFEINLWRVNAGVETLLYSRFIFLPPLWNEEWTLILGSATNARNFKILRSGFEIANFTETGTGSVVGSSNRGGGFGMVAGAGFTTQDVPPAIFDWAMGDNATITQSGHLQLTNFGDQEAFPDLVIYGPGTFVFGNGPGTQPTITFGPLTDNQIALVKTAPGQRSVTDLTASHSEQDLPFFQNYLKTLISYSFNNNVPPLQQWFESLFGILPTQGNLYALLKGRWSKGVPPKALGELPTTSEISVQIQNGNASSKVVAALTPLRRWPE